MIEFLKKYWILFFLGGLVIILLLLKIFYGNTGTNQVNEVTPTPTPIISEGTVPNEETATPTQINTDSDKPDTEAGQTMVLPFKGQKMEITGYVRPGVLQILIKKEEDRAEAETEVKAWLEQYPTFKSNSLEYKIAD